MKPLLKFFLLIPCILSLTACGGGSGGGSNPPQPQPPIPPAKAGHANITNLGITSQPTTTKG